jgi:hypothetical protein
MLCFLFLSVRAESVRQFGVVESEALVDYPRLNQTAGAMEAMTTVMSDSDQANNSA